MNMTNIKVSELFYSIQGEGRYVGVPSVFLRTFGCNLKCEGFGMPAGEKSNERNLIKFNDDKPFTTIHDLPLVATGCDSYGSWDTRFKKLSKDEEVHKLALKLLAEVPNKSWLNTTSSQRTHLVITGGEPLILKWQKAYPALLGELEFQGLRDITFETNGTQSLSKEFLSFLWHANFNITFSVSPKLSISGEKHNKAIIPSIIKEYTNVGSVYLKFVASSADEFDEIESVVLEYKDAGVLCDIYIMPAGGMDTMYKQNAPVIAELCLKHGYKYSPRLHVDVFGNAWGT